MHQKVWKTQYPPDCKINVLGCYIDGFLCLLHSRRSEGKLADMLANKPNLANINHFPLQLKFFLVWFVFFQLAS